MSKNPQTHPQKTGKKNPPLGSQVLIDLNILPDRYRRRKVKPDVVLAFLLLAVLLGLLYPAGAYFLEAQKEFSAVKAEFSRLETDIENYQSVEERQVALQADIDQTNQQVEEFRTRYDEINLSYTSWSSLLFSIVESYPPGVEIQEINQSGTQVVLEGSAASYDQVLTLRDNLRGLGSFPIVQIDSIQFLTAEEFPGESTEDFPYLFNITLKTREEVSQP